MSDFWKFQDSDWLKSFTSWSKDLSQYTTLYIRILQLLNHITDTEVQVKKLA